MNCKISVDLKTLEIKKTDELVDIFDVKVEDDILHLEIYRVNDDPIIPYNNLP